MKKLILIISFFPMFLYSQEKVYFEITDKALSEVDSIVFKGKDVWKLGPIYKIKKKKKIEFTVYKDLQETRFKVKSSYFNQYNTILSISTDDDSISRIIINEGHIERTLFQKKSIANMKIKIQTLISLIDKEGNIDRGSDNFNYYISNNPAFFGSIPD